MAKRVIEFRGKRKDNGKWVYGYLWIIPGVDLYYILTGKIDIRDCSIEKYEVIPETIGQYTGMKDSKRTKEYPEGQKVYENDYLCVSGYSYEEPEDDWEGIVTAGQLGWGIMGYSSNGDKNFYYLSEIGGSYITKYDDLGNIHDNPELLKEE